MTFLRLHQIELIERYGVRLVDTFTNKLDFCANVLGLGAHTTGLSCGAALAGERSLFTELHPNSAELLLTPPCVALFRAASTVAALTFSGVKGGVAVSACMSLSGRLSEVAGLEQKIRGAHASGLTHVIISDENAHGGRVVEKVLVDRVGVSYEYRVVTLEKSVRQALTILSAPTIFDVLDLCLVADDPQGMRPMLIVGDSSRADSLSCTTSTGRRSWCCAGADAAPGAEDCQGPEVLVRGGARALGGGGSHNGNRARVLHGRNRGRI
jgi:hypothetical protein